MDSVHNGKRMTWEEIKATYPHQNVGLVDLEPNNLNFETAVVYCTDKEKSYSELIRMAINKEIIMMYTTMDEDDGLC